jgi:hypothetical protein
LACPPFIPQSEVEVQKEGRGSGINLSGFYCPIHRRLTGNSLIQRETLREPAALRLRD